MNKSSGNENDIEFSAYKETRWDIVVYILSSKPLRWLGGFLLFLILTGSITYGIWYARENHIWSYFFQPTSIAIQVLSDLDMSPVLGASVTIGGITAVTDTLGEIEFSTVSTGIHPVLVEAPHHYANEKEVEVVQGFNTSTVVIEAEPAKLSFIAVVRDSISQKGLSDVSIESAYGLAWTDENGMFVLNDLPSGEIVTATFTKPGFTTNEQDIEISLNQSLDFYLAPEGTAFFIKKDESNKRAIYSSDYAGTNPLPLVERLGSTEDFELYISPNQDYIAFLSTRDQRRIEGEPRFFPSLFLIESNGSNLITLSTEFGIDSIQWSSNGTHLAWRNNFSLSDTSKDLYLYRLEDNYKEKLNDPFPVSNYVFSHAGDTISWNQFNIITDDNESNYRLTYRKLDSEEKTTITTEKTWQFYFNEDDTALVYKRIYVDENESKDEYLQYNLEARETFQYTPETEIPQTKIISPNKTEYAYTLRADGKSNVYIQSHDGETVTPLTSIDSVSGSPHWDPSGNYLLFNSFTTDEAALYIVSRNGGTPLKVSDIYLSSQLSQ